MKEKNIFETQKIANPNKIERSQANEILSDVFSALTDKGYNPVNQIVGYILSGDPTYITSHNNARSTIGKIERDELLEELVTCYLNNNLKG